MEKGTKIGLAVGTVIVAGVAYAFHFSNRIGYRRNGKMSIDASLREVKVTVPILLINRNGTGVKIKGFEGTIKYGKEIISDLSIDKFDLKPNSETPINIYATSTPLRLFGNVLNIINNRLVSDFKVKGKILTSAGNIPYSEKYTIKDIIKLNLPTLAPSMGNIGAMVLKKKALTHA